MALCTDRGRVGTDGARVAPPGGGSGVDGARCPPTVCTCTRPGVGGLGEAAGGRYGACVQSTSSSRSAGAQGPVEVRRSARRRRTVTAYRQDGRTVVLIPASFSRSEERTWVDRMVAKLETRESRGRRTLGSDEELMVRARTLSEAYLDGVLPASVRWVDNQNRRWGSCTPADRTIRLSSRLRTMPDYVVDYVLVHELAHLVRPAHDAAFWALVERYPRAERALGYLEGVEAAQPG